MRCWQWVMIHSIRTRIRLSVSSCHVNVWKNPEQLIRQSGSSLHWALWVKGSCSRGGCSRGESAFPDALWMTDVEAEQPLWSQAILDPLAVGQYCRERWWREGHEDILHFIWGLFLWYAGMNPWNNTDVLSNTQGMSFELYADTCSEGNVRKAFRQQQIKLCDLEFN